MADNPESMEHLLSCHVCLEEFTESGDHIPRLLPCTHTLFDSCIKRLIKDNKLVCPECRSKHEAKNEERSFTQNKYILSQLKRSCAGDRKEEHYFPRCEEHGKEVNLFCKQAGCNKSICRSCLSRNHLGHKVVEIEEQKTEALLRNIKTIEKHLGIKLTKICEAKEEIKKLNAKILPKMKLREEELIEEIEELARKTKKDEDEFNTKVDDEVEVLHSYQNLLEQMKHNVNTTEENTYEDLVKSLENVTDIAKTLQKDHSGERCFNYPEFHVHSYRSFGWFRMEDITVELPEVMENALIFNPRGKYDLIYADDNLANFGQILTT